MAERITKTNLRKMFEHAYRCARSAGLDTEGWTLEMGSATNGVSYVLISHMHHERLGGTMTEAYRRLDAMARAWQMIAQANAANGN